MLTNTHLCSWLCVHGVETDAGLAGAPLGGVRRCAECAVAEEVGGAETTGAASGRPSVCAAQPAASRAATASAEALPRSQQAIRRLYGAAGVARANQVGEDGRMQPAEVIADLRPRLSGALIATDFDGTLAPIVKDPEDSRTAAGALAALTALAHRGAHVGVVTGRDARTAVRLGGLDAVPGVLVEGLYGLEQWQAGTLTSPEMPDAIRELRAVLPQWLTQQQGDEGVWVEDKRLSLVVHTRPAADPAGAFQRLQRPAKELADRLGIELHPGRYVLEFRVPGYDKGAALRRLVERTRPTAVLYAGDDLGDLPAFGVIAELRAARTPAWSVAAVSAELPALAQAADVIVDGPAGVVQLLGALAS